MNPLGAYVALLESEEAQALFSIPVIGPILGLMSLIPIGVGFLLVFALAIILVTAPGILLHTAK